MLRNSHCECLGVNTFVAQTYASHELVTWPADIGQRISSTDETRASGRKLDGASHSRFSAVVALVSPCVLGMDHAHVDGDSGGDRLRLSNKDGEP